QVTRGAVYHHFDGKQALFEAVLDAQETRAIATITAAATAADPLEAARQALDAFLDQCCDPVYGRLVWLEGPTALGWHRWRECEQKYAYGLVERFITALVDAGYLADRALGSLVRFSFWMLGGAGLALAEAPEADRPRLREEWRYLIGQTNAGLRHPSRSLWGRDDHVRQRDVVLPGMHVPVVQAALHDRTREGHLDHVQVRDAKDLQGRGGDVVQLADQLGGDERVRDSV